MDGGLTADSRLIALYRCIIVLLFCFILFLHIYRLDQIPRGMEIDEVGMAYDSWCIGNFGVDRYLNSFPVYLTNYGAGQSIMYCYLAVPFMKNGGFNVLAARMPGMIFSLITCVFGFLLIHRIRGRLAGLIFLFLYAAVPYFTQSGRMALDCNLMLGCTVIVLYVLERCIFYEKTKTWPYIVLGLVTGCTLYSYALSYLIMPLFFILLYPLLMLFGKRITWKQIIAFILPAVILSIPLIIVQMVNLFGDTDLVIGFLTFPKLLNYRATELSLSEIRSNIGWIYRSVFRADNQEFDSFPQFGALYIISLPIIIVGGIITTLRVIRGIREKKVVFDGIILLLVVVIMGVALTLTGVTTYRINAVFFGLVFLMVVTIETLFARVRTDTLHVFNVILTLVGTLIIISYVVYAASFIRYYFCVYEDEYYPQRLFAEDPAEAYEMLESMDDETKNRLTYVGGANEAYAYYLLSMRIPPYDYDINEYGNNGDGTKFLFYAPEPYDRMANYIIYLPDDEVDNALKNLGFERNDAGAYGVYVHK